MSKPSIVFSDFDGTLTLDHYIIHRFIDVIDLLEKNNIPLVITTGRPIEWGYFF